LPVIAEKHKSYFSVIPEKTYQESLHAYSENNFVKFLLGLYGIPITNKLIKQYHIGTSKHWHGASIFWEVDIAGHIRSGKIMLYNAETGKRVKEPYDYLTWVHSVLELHEFKLQQCLFGEHLLNQNMEKPVAIFESEKTAIIASVHFPEYICLSCGGSNNINLDKCKVLKGRRVTFFPDLSPPSAKQSCYQKWKLLSTDLAKAVPDAEFVVSDLLENNSTDSEKQQGLDIADYLGRFSFVELQERNISKP
jgi:hypothetical protein